MSKRSVARLSVGMEKRLAAYTVAGVASLATVVPTGQGAVVYTEVKVKCPLTGYSVTDIDLNRDGVTDFTLINVLDRGTYTHTGALFVSAAVGDKFGVNESMYPNAFNFGSRIGPKLIFGSGEELMAGVASKFVVGSGFYPIFSGGPFANAQNKFLGLKLVADGKIFYGWARIDTKIDLGNGGVGVVCGLIDYAYDDTPNTPINAGQGIKPGSDTSTLGWMAVGSDGLSELRSKPNQ